MTYGSESSNGRDNAEELGTDFGLGNGNDDRGDGGDFGGGGGNGDGGGTDGGNGGTDRGERGADGVGNSSGIVGLENGNVGHFAEVGQTDNSSGNADRGRNGRTGRTGRNKRAGSTGGRLAEDGTGNDRNGGNSEDGESSERVSDVTSDGPLIGADRKPRKVKPVRIVKSKKGLKPLFTKDEISQLSDMIFGGGSWIFGEDFALDDDENERLSEAGYKVAEQFPVSEVHEVSEKLNKIMAVIGLIVIASQILLPRVFIAWRQLAGMNNESISTENKNGIGTGAGRNTNAASVVVPKVS